LDTRAGFAQKILVTAQHDFDDNEFASKKEAGGGHLSLKKIGRGPFSREPKKSIAAEIRGSFFVCKESWAIRRKVFTRLGLGKEMRGLRKADLIKNPKGKAPSEDYRKRGKL